MADLAALLSAPVHEVAPRLLGAVLRHAGVGVRLTEVEAYGGPDDPGSHAFRGRTPRNETMFGPPGRLYVYFTYGMHHCCNVVTGGTGEPGAVLLRAGEVVEGHELAQQRRPRSTTRDLARGPARLCEVLGISRDQDGVDLAAGPVVLEPGVAAAAWETGPRVGLRGAPERRWRFWVPGEPTVSAYRPAATRRGPGPDLGSPERRC